MSVPLVIGRLVLLVVGAEALCRGAAGFARRLGVPSLVVGLIVVAYGTTVPELSVSTLAAVIRPLGVHAGLIRAVVPIMILVAGIGWFVSRDGAVGRPDGVILSVLLIGFTGIVIARAGGARSVAESDPSSPIAPRPGSGQRPGCGQRRYHSNYSRFSVGSVCWLRGPSFSFAAGS